MVKVQGAKSMTLNQRKNDAHVMFWQVHELGIESA